jgi:hypothetical protein
MFTLPSPLTITVRPSLAGCTAMYITTPEGVEYSAIFDHTGKEIGWMSTPFLELYNSSMEDVIRLTSQEEVNAFFKL